MWEYRIFNENGFEEKIADIIDFESTDAEERTDYYYDFDRKEYGLKERLSEEDSSKLELKIRFDKRSTHGIEYWEKVISHPYPDHQNSHLPLYQIEDIIEQKAVENKEFGSDIEYFQRNISTDFEITKVSKTRWENELIIDGYEVEIEYGIVEIHDETLYSFSIESENLDLVEELIEKWGLDRKQFSGGYPSLVNALNNTIKLTTPTN